MNRTDVSCALRAAKYAAFFFVCCALTCVGGLCLSANVAVAVPQQSEGVGVAIPRQGAPNKRPAATKNLVELPPVTISGFEREVTFDLLEIQRLLKAGETLEIEVLTKEGKEYAGELAEFYRRADTFCLMAALSSDLVVAQQCPRGNATQVLERWANAINYLGEIARGGNPDKRATASYAAFVRANPGTVDLILNGRRVVTAKVKDLLGIIKGTTPMANPGEIEFEGCSFPAKATGEKLSKVCHSSLPLAPVEPSLTDKENTLVVVRQTGQKASVIVRMTPRKENSGKRVRKAAQEPLVVLLPVELAQASNPTTASTDTTSSTAGSTTSTETTSTTDGTTTSEHSSESSSSSSIGNTGNSTETTSTTEATTTSLETTTVTEDTTTTTSVSSEPAFTSRCGETNTLKAWTKLERTDRTYVGWACNPLSEHNGCFVNSKGECPDVIERKAECKTFCREYPNRLAEYEKNKAAAQKACADRIKEKAQNLPSAVGMCPGAEACPGGTKGCINPSGNGSFELSIPDGTMRWDPPSRDEWNECFTYFCDPMPFEEITYTWQCSGCESESSESSSPDTTSTTEGTTTSEYSSESSSSSSTGDTESSTETTSTTEETSTSLDTTMVTEDTTTTTSVSSEPTFTSRCGETNTLKAWTKIEPTDRKYVGWACKPLSEYDVCSANVRTGRCQDTFAEMPRCKQFCEEYPKRLAEYEKNKAAAQKACADEVKRRAQNIPSAAGMCPGDGGCESGQKGCINPSGDGGFELSMPDGTMSWDPPSRDEWNDCFTYYCDPMAYEQITYTWQCSGCESESSESSSPDTTSTTEVTTTSNDSSESSSFSSTGHTESSTETTSSTEETTTSLETMTSTTEESSSSHSLSL